MPIGDRAENLDMRWASYFASGRAAFVEQIASVLGQAGPDDTILADKGALVARLRALKESGASDAETLQLLVQSAARWSLTDGWRGRLVWRRRSRT